MAGVHDDSWLGGILGTPAFRVDAAATDAELAALPATSFAYAKVDAKDAAGALRLQDAGFRVVDVNVMLSRGPAPALPAPAARVARVAPAEAGPVLDIAGSCYRYSRFHLDPRVPDEKAHLVKRRWVENYAAGKRGDGLYAVYDGARPAGFLAVLVSGSQAVIDLIGVDTAAQGRGFGRDLVRFFVAEYGPRCPELSVGTQVANVPSLRLYESCGFSVSKTSLVLHRHRP